MIRVALLWHMHQPVYVNPFSGRAELPWVRLHGIKDYSGMAGVLGEFPGVRSTVNLVPSLLLQLKKHLAGEIDRFQEVAQKPAADLDAVEKTLMARHFFSLHPVHMIQPFPRYQELYSRRSELAQGNGTSADWRDLQVWSTLAWFDADRARADERVQGLREKGRGFSEADKIMLFEAQHDHLAGVIPAWRDLESKGLVEVSTSPMTHAILPLLLDPRVGRVANPTLPLYDLDFNWEGDARRHVQDALDFMQHHFGVRPRGIWPSEGSLSEKVLDLFQDLGVTWTASDEINLARSLNPGKDADWSGLRDKHLYRPWIAGKRELRILFRDHDLSDRIGFHYQKMNPQEAVEDFMLRLREIGQQVKDAVVGVFLDGENPWEHYPDNGRAFLRNLLARLQRDEQVEAVTLSEAVSMKAERLRSLSPGSWINGNFDIWIGDESDRRAWKQLQRTRDHFIRNKDQLSEHETAEAQYCLDVAQGSDWFWWFGPEHHTGDLEVFDRLFRLNLRRVYELTGTEPPTELIMPISSAMDESLIKARPPIRPLNPVLDGEVTHFFEWRDAGRLNIHAGQGVMNTGESVLVAVYYGFGDGRFFLRVDTRDQAKERLHRKEQLRLGLRLPGGAVRKLVLPPEPGFGNGAVGSVIECELALDALNLAVGDRFELNLEWRRDGRVLQILPQDGFFAIDVPGPKDYATYWRA